MTPIPALKPKTQHFQAFVVTPFSFSIIFSENPFSARVRPSVTAAHAPAINSGYEPEA
jgi:hypothetical protein